MSPTRIALSGSTGFIGTHVAAELKRKGYEVWPMMRRRGPVGAQEIFYDYERGIIDEDALRKCDALIHLAGKNIMSGLWTPRFKRELWESRVASTRLIAGAMARGGGPGVFICASAVGFYGDGGNEVLDERAPRGMGFLAQLCEAWEEETRVAGEAGVRVVNMRFGAVLGKNGGMLKGLQKMFGMGLGAVMGSGKQYMAVVGIDDVVGALGFVLEHEGIAGALNVLCPQPVTQEEFARGLARALESGLWLRVPAWVLKALGEQGRMMLASCRAVPQVLVDAGYDFLGLNGVAVVRDIYGK